MHTQQLYTIISSIQHISLIHAHKSHPLSLTHTHKSDDHIHPSLILSIQPSYIDID
jgi:hypothetical protein